MFLPIFSLRWDLNLDCWSERQACWPPSHNQSPTIAVLQQKLSMTRFEQWSLSVQSNHSTQCATESHPFTCFIFKYGPIPASFCLQKFFSRHNYYKLKKTLMLCSVFEPGAAEWQAKTNPLSYGDHPTVCLFVYAGNLQMIVTNKIYQILSGWGSASHFIVWF